MRDALRRVSLGQRAEIQRQGGIPQPHGSGGRVHLHERKIRVCGGGLERFLAGQRAAFPRGVPYVGHRAHGHVHPVANRVPFLGEQEQFQQFRFHRRGLALRVVQRPHALNALVRFVAVEDRVVAQKFRLRLLAEAAERSLVARVGGEADDGVERVVKFILPLLRPRAAGKERRERAKQEPYCHLSHALSILHGREKCYRTM